MAKVNHDLTKILTPKYAEKWVAMDSEQTKVVASAETPGKALEKARKLGVNKPVITFAVKDYGYLIP